MDYFTVKAMFYLQITHHFISPYSATRYIIILFARLCFYKLSTLTGVRFLLHGSFKFSTNIGNHCMLFVMYNTSGASLVSCSVIANKLRRGIQICITRTSTDGPVYQTWSISHSWSTCRSRVIIGLIGTQCVTLFW